MNEMPVLALVTSGAGTMPKYAIEFGHQEAGKTVSTVADADTAMFRTGGNVATNIVLTQGIQVKINGADYYIPVIAVGDWKND